MHRPILFATLLVILAGCGGTPANQAAQAPGQPAAQPPAAISVATPDGRAEVRTGAGAASYPDGLAPYPGATADQSVNVTGGSAQRSGRIIAFRTGDPAARVIGFYADAAGRAGYRIVNRMDTGSSATLMIQRGAGESVSISATRIGDYTQAQIITVGTAAAQ